jgi:DNA-binding transcriptional MerR regulator
MEEEMYRINQLAQQFGLSRSTLLYYDRIGLLNSSRRTEAGYRVYSPKDRDRLEAICSYRQAGLTIDDIKTILTVEGDGTVSVLRKRLRELGGEIRSLLLKQRVIAGMLAAHAAGSVPELVDKDLWIEMLRAAGMDDNAMIRWHAEFERRAPEAHHAFLLSLGIVEKQVHLIRKRSAWSEEDAMMRQS